MAGKFDGDLIPRNASTLHFKNMMNFNLMI